MKKSFIIIAMLLLSVASFALSDMVSINYADGSRTIPVEDVERIYYSATTDSLDIQLADTNYYYKADADLQITFLDSIEGQHKRERETLIAIYKALDGDNWINNENWCSDKPLDEWADVDTEYGYITHIDLTHLVQFSEINSLYLEVPQEIYNLCYIRHFNSQSCALDITRRISNWKNLYNLTVLVKPHSTIAEELFLCEQLKHLILISKDNAKLPAGISTNMLNIETLYLYDFADEFPSYITTFSNLWGFGANNLSGSLPTGLNKLPLTQFGAYNGSLSGNIPADLFLSNTLHIIDLHNNQLTGTIPREFYYIMSNGEGHVCNYDPGVCSWKDIRLDYNYLSGDISQEIQNHPNWCMYWPTTVLNNRFNLKNLYLQGPKFEGVDIDGDSIYSKDVYSKNKYTILCSFDTDLASSEACNWNIHRMKEFHQKYINLGVEILYAASEWETEEQLKTFKEEYDVPFRCFNTNRNLDNRILINNEKQTAFFQYYLTPESLLGNSVMVVDSTDNTVFMSDIDGYESELDQFLYRNLCKDSIDYYVSSDYSQHMMVDTLQIATIGKGIDIVLMGDAYSDRQIADSTYHKDLQYLYENLFTEEPYKSYKEMFNVFTVNVVSPTEGYEHGSTALGGFFGYETEVGGNDGAVIEYARRVIPSHKLDNAMIIVAMNSNKYAGTCYMYYPSDTTITLSDTTITFGSGLSISYFPKGGDATTFAQLLHHEALGHGFAKLADEYAYEHYGAVPESTIALHQEQQTNWGWWKNIDFTNDSTEIRWSRLLLDERYQYDGLGAFEGGLTYWTGVWRPTENSIMRYNTGGFNAPSREAIYYRIHKLAYGDEWEYDYEKFVEWDAKNRKTAEIQLLMPSRDKMENFTPTHPPVIKQMSWREAVEQKAQQKVKAMPEERNSTSATTQQGAKIVYTTRK